MTSPYAAASMRLGPGTTLDERYRLTSVLGDGGTGSVYDYTLDELRQFDFGGKFHPLYSGEPIPTLDEVLGFMAHSGLRPVLRLSRSELRKSRLRGSTTTPHRP